MHQPPGIPADLCERPAPGSTKLFGEPRALESNPVSSSIQEFDGLPGMISITEDFVEAAGPNAEAAKNGRGLVLKNKFLKLHHSPDETLWFGQCQGSGKTP